MPIQATPEARATGTRRGWALPLRGPRWAEQPSRASRLPQEPAHRAARVLACPPRGRLAAPRTCVVGLSPAACRACWPRRSRSALDRFLVALAQPRKESKVLPTLEPYLRRLNAQAEGAIKLFMQLRPRRLTRPSRLWN